MLDAVEYAVFGLFFLLFAYTVYCSFKYRRQRDADLRGLYQARMNIGMGGALTLLALNILLLIPGTNVSFAVGIVFLLIGLYNLYAGARNHALFSGRLRKKQ